MLSLKSLKENNAILSERHLQKLERERGKKKKMNTFFIHVFFLLMGNTTVCMEKIRILFK